MIRSILKGIVSQFTLILSNLLVIIIIGIATDSQLVKILSLLFGGLGIVSLIRLIASSRNPFKAPVSNLAAIAMSGILFTNAAGFSTFEGDHMMAPGLYTTASLVILVIFLFEAVSRGMFLLRFYLSGELGMAEYKLQKVIKGPYHSWNQKINFEVQMAKGRSAKHEAYGEMLVKIAHNFGTGKSSS